MPQARAFRNPVSRPGAPFPGTPVTPGVDTSAALSPHIIAGKEAGEAIEKRELSRFVARNRAGGPKVAISTGREYRPTHGDKENEDSQQASCSLPRIRPGAARPRRLGAGGRRRLWLYPRGGRLRHGDAGR